MNKYRKHFHMKIDKDQTIQKKRKNQAKKREVGKIEC